MKKCLFSILLFLCGHIVLAQIINKEEKKVLRILHFDNKKIQIDINTKKISGTLSPEINPDRVMVYCELDSNLIRFYSKTDSLSFWISQNDTIPIKIIINNLDTANIEVIALKELPRQIGITEKLYYFSKIWSEIKYNFINIDQLPFNIDSLYRAYIPLVLNSKNDYEYYFLLKRFMACLKDGHSEVNSGQFSIFSDYVPITISDFDNKLYITNIKKCPEIDSLWLGAEIIEISGIRTDKFLIDSIFPYISASTERHLWMQGTSKLAYDLKWKPFRAKIKKKDGKTEYIRIARNGESTRTDDDQYYGKSTIYNNKKVELNYTDDNIAVLSVNTFYPQEVVIKELKNEMAKLTKAKGLIIDLRRNGGGTTGVAHYLQSFFTPGKYFLNYAWESRINDGVKKANGNWIKEYEDYYKNKALRFVEPDTIYVPDSIERIKIPIAILIGRYTFSAAEDFLVNIYEVPGRPILIGEETGGSTGSPLVIPDFQGGGSTRICTRRICFPYSKKPFVNQGIKPDIEVKQTINDYMQGKDVVLERAVKIIKKKIE